MRVPIAVYSGARISLPFACSAAIATRTGFHACIRPSRYCSGRSSLFSLSTARLMTWKFTSMSRTFSTSRIHREVIQHHGHSGSNQKSATDFSGMHDPFGVAADNLPPNTTTPHREVFPAGRGAVDAGDDGGRARLGLGKH